MEEYRVEMRVKNNLILSKIEEVGFESIAAFSKASGICLTTIHNLCNLKTSAVTFEGKYRKVVNELCDFLNCSVEELFSAAQMDMALSTNRRSFQVKEAEMKFMLEQTEPQKLLEDCYLVDQRENAVSEVLKNLPMREKRIIEMRMGLGEYKDMMTLEQCAESEGCTRERIRQIEAKALRRMRHPKMAHILRELI